MKRVVLFDFFGVICSEISPFWFRRYFDDAEADAIKADIVSKADVGLISEDETFALISERTGVAPDKIKSDWYELVSINTELVEYIKKVKKSYPVYLLSNAISPFLKRILEENDLYCLFDKVYISSELKIAKPDPEFFRRCLADIGINADETVMIDDNPSNIGGAVEAGITGLLFKDNESFFEEFEKYYSI